MNLIYHTSYIPTLHIHTFEHIFYVPVSYCARTYSTVKSILLLTRLIPKQRSKQAHHRLHFSFRSRVSRESKKPSSARRKQNFEQPKLFFRYSSTFLAFKFSSPHRRQQSKSQQRKRNTTTRLHHVRVKSFLNNPFKPSKHPLKQGLVGYNSLLLSLA